MTEHDEDGGIVGRSAPMQRVRERVEVEGADQARVEALPVEHRDVAEEARHGVEDRAAGVATVRELAGLVYWGAVWFWLTRSTCSASSGSP